MKRPTGLIFTAGALALTLAGTVVFAQGTPSTNSRPAAIAPVAGSALVPAIASRAPLVPVAVTKPEKVKDAIRVLLTPDRETTLSSPVAAKLKQISVSMGSPFAAGQSLVELDCDEPMARLSMAQAELGGAVETHEAKVRMQGLEQASDVEVALAASAVEKDRAQVQLYKAQTRQCAIVAPWAGRVAKVHVRSYMTAAPGQPLFDLVKNGPLKLRLNMPSKALSQVKVGQDFDVNIEETGKLYQARIKAINSRVDPVSQTIELEGVMARSYPDLLSGMSGTARLFIATDAQ